MSSQDKSRLYRIPFSVMRKHFAAWSECLTQKLCLQTDLYGLAGTIHVLMFGCYMNVYCQDGVWRINKTFRR